MTLMTSQLLNDVNVNITGAVMSNVKRVQKRYVFIGVGKYSKDVTQNFNLVPKSYFMCYSMDGTDCGYDVIFYIQMTVDIAVKSCTRKFWKCFESK